MCKFTHKRSLRICLPHSLCIVKHIFIIKLLVVFIIFHICVILLFLLWGCVWVATSTGIAFAEAIVGTGQTCCYTAALCCKTGLQPRFAVTADHVQEGRRSNRACIQDGQDDFHSLLLAPLLAPSKLCDIHSWWVRAICCFPNMEKRWCHIWREHGRSRWCNTSHWGYPLSGLCWGQSHPISTSVDDR